LGFGPETFSIHFPRYQSQDLARAYPGFFQESPHNIFIDALAGQGVPGVAILIGLTAVGFYSIWKERHRMEAAALGAAFVALLISQEFTSFTMPTAVYLYVTVALAAGLASGPISFPPGRGRTIKTVCCVLLSVIFIAYGVALAGTDAGLARVDRLMRAGKPGEAAAFYAKIRRWQPPGVRTDLWYSRAMAGASQRAQSGAEAIAAAQQALAAAIRASRNSDEPENAWLNLAVFYGRLNDPVHTEQSLRAAISCAPNWFKPHWLLAQALRVAGRLQEARTEAMLAAELDGGKDPEVARTAAEIVAATK
jgi:tetratricopeptide (TPR) repeat protein